MRIMQIEFAMESQQSIQQAHACEVVAGDEKPDFAGLDWLDPVWSTKYNFITHHIPPDTFNDMFVYAHTYKYKGTSTYAHIYTSAFCFGQIWQEVVGNHASLIVTLRPHPPTIFVCSKQKHYLLGNPCVSLPTPCGVSSGWISDKIQIPQWESLLTSSMVSTKLDDVSRCIFYGRKQISTETLRPSIKWPLLARDTGF